MLRWMLIPMNNNKEEIFMSVKSILDGIVSDIEQHNSTVTTIMAEYRTVVAAAKQEAAAYKDEAGELAKRKTPLIATTRHRIKAADERLAGAVSAAVSKLKKEMSGYLSKPANPELLAQLKTYTDFGLKMSRTELDAHILAAEGNYTALRAIQKVAADSGFTVTIQEGFEEDLATIARLGHVPSMYCPHEYLSEGLEVLPDRPFFREDGTAAHSTGRPDSIYLLIKSGAFNAARRELANISEKWGTAFVPTISELKPVRDHETGAVLSTPEQQHAQVVEAAAETVDIKTTIQGLKADPNCQAILDLYI